MAVVAILALLVLGIAPLVAAVSELVVAPGALIDVFLSPRILSLWGATIGLGLSVAAVSLLVGVPVGRALARGRGRGVGLLAALLPVPLILPPWLAGIAWLTVLPLSGFLGATFLLSASLWPLVALFALRGFRAAGRAADAAALFRGPHTAWWRVELPMALPSILSGALLVFLFAITDFGVVDLLSFSSAEPFVVLSSEIFQKWARVSDATDTAAAVSLASMLPSVIALLGVLVLERRHAGRHRGAGHTGGVPRPIGPGGITGLVIVGLAMAVPVGVLLTLAAGGDSIGPTLATARDDMLRSVAIATGTGLLVAALGISLARLSLSLSPRRETWLLALCLAPLAAPGVMFAVGEIRLWNHPANPLADTLYSSPLLLVLGLSGRYIALGVLAARALLSRQDPTPFQAARLVPRPRWQRWTRIELPLLAPATGLAFALGYLLSMRELDLVVLIPAGSATLAHRIFSYVHLATDDVAALLCLSLVLLVLVPAVAARLLGVPGVDCDGPGGDP